MITWACNMNKNGNLDPIQNLILLKERPMFDILFCYCHHFVFKDYVIQILSLTSL